MAVYQRKKNTWRIEVDVGFDTYGKRKRLIETLKGSKTEAKAREAEIRSKVKSGSLLEKNTYSFEEFSNKWLKEHAIPTMGPRTVETYKYYLKNINGQIGFIKITHLKPLHLIKFYNYLRNLEGKEKLADATIQKHYSIINAILNKAVKWKIIHNNPNLDIDKPKIKKTEAKYYDLDQTRKLINSLELEPPMHKALILLALDTGARRGEIIALEWNDIDYKNKSITINKTVQYVAGKGLIEKDPKTNSSYRKVAITDISISVLQEWELIQQETKKKLKKVWAGSNKVFTTSEGKTTLPETASKIFTNILKKHNLPHINFHGLRHTSVSLLIASGIHSKVISDRVGHSSIATTTNIYSHVFESVTNEVRSKLNTILENK